MKSYSYYGFSDFIVALGVKSEIIKNFFLNYDYLCNDFTVDFKNENSYT